MNIDKLFDISGKIALVTGGARGIGAMITEGLVRAGVKVYISSRKAQACENMAAKMSEYGSCETIPADLSTLEGIELLSGELGAREEKLDILINNSGVTWGADLDEFPEKGWDRVMDLNVKTPFFLTQKLLPLLRKAATVDSPASVINISSIAAVATTTMNAYSYGPSKAAVNQLTRNLARDLVKSHINVNAIAPGLFPSKMTAHMLRDEEMQQKMANVVPMGRLGRPEDIAGLVIYMVSPSGSFMTGNIIPLDGGELIKH
jgi:NAD(P)-dependent dehydrogenase (short-subunit alcohol dehydrogenase family)